MKKIRCLLVDDEPPAIELLAKYASMIDHLEVVGTSHSAIKAFDMMKNTDVDLLFLDIRMPVLNGIDFLKALKNPPAVILTTAYRDYAIEGYDLDIIDYLLKPIAFDRFIKSIDRYNERMKGKVMHATDTKNKDVEMDHIFVNVNRTHHKVILKKILFVESLKDYVRIHLPEDNLVVKGNIGSFLKLLPSRDFIRIHRSFIVPLQKIDSFNQSSVDIGSINLPIGISYREEIKQRLGKKN